LLCSIIMVKTNIKIDVCLFKNYVSLNLLCAYYYIDMRQVVIELSYVDCVLFPVDAGFLVEVIRLGL
jgi:hypothetical protein